jgi:hypothetical protein
MFVGTSHAAPSFDVMSALLSVPSGIRSSLDEAIDTTAARFVRAWGFTTVGMVARRFRLTTTTSESRLSIARRVLSRSSDLRWLDPICEWFTLIERDSKPKAALSKILSVRGHVDREELSQALDKRHSFRDVPNDVVRAYVSELVSHHARTAKRVPPDASALTRIETVLVDVLLERGGRAEIELLRRDVRRWSITAEALKRTLSESPLFIRVAHGRYGLIGSPIAPRSLIPSGRWAAAV